MSAGCYLVFGIYFVAKPPLRNGACFSVSQKRPGPRGSIGCYDR